MDFAQMRGQPPAHMLRMPARADGRPLEADLMSLADWQAQKENALQKDLDKKVQEHRQRNENYVDVTREPLSPVHTLGTELSFRPVTAQYQLMTPPASVTSESSGEQLSPSKMDVEIAHFRFNSPPPEPEHQSQPAYRRRIGRLGRLWVDRRGMPTAAKEIDESVFDRWKYDQDDNDEQPVYEMDPYSTPALRFRSTIPSSLVGRRPPQAELPRPVNASPTAVRTVAVTQPAPT